MMNFADPDIWNPKNQYPKEGRKKGASNLLGRKSYTRSYSYMGKDSIFLIFLEIRNIPIILITHWDMHKNN